ncbi:MULTISPECIES: ABC-F family ATP-binding cassette domain-containing protein [unclassified Candidatus Frackibacter]|nr:MULTISPECIES: ABC-F family ATP-binding cassette domain-containing protein [unclassified Candidatus Frackibacter]SDC30154.1 ATP-binding cassette, subfamily F, member 3 [Candidatus Frackibacter sp. WG11]SFL57989.1 ATP-binding cassette, subfamily F, member 3 [Candidatus Frackibacter sp. WG13]
MALLQLRKGNKVYPEQIIFQDISLQIQKDDKIGLIGVNGTGKSTLLRVLTQNESLDQGEILVSDDLEMGYLTQNLDLELDTTLYQAMLSIYQDLFSLEERLRKLEAQMSQVVGSELDKVMKKYSRLRQKYEEEGGYEYESQIKGVLRGLGFKEDEFKEQLINFSGGQKTRAALARLLLQEPDLLLLDEPTNHLDLEAKEWLEDYLINYTGALVIISHDRYFLDQVINRVWELEKGRLEKYKGNYSFYLEEKEHRLLTWQREYEKQQKKIKKTEAYIRKNKAGVNSKQARGRQKKLDRMERIPPPPKLSKPKIDFNVSSVSGQEVLEIRGLTKSYGKETLFEDINFKLYRGEKVALVGPNGSGKSTLFKLLLNQEEADLGKIKLGARVKMGYYAQENENLSLDYNLVEELQKVDEVTKSQARDLLARFLFQGDDVFKEIATLSGGEKARVSLAKLTLEEHNLLLLDEPTNHLDIRSKELLEEALQNYSGTVIIISHDRYFLDEVVDKVFALQDEGLVEYRGDYSNYRQEYRKLIASKKEEKKRERESVAKVKKQTAKKQVDLEELESKIISLEEKVERLEKEFNNEELYDNVDDLNDLTGEYEETKEKLNQYYNIWEESI